MPKLAVVDGAVLKCIAGSAPSKLTVTTDPFTQIEHALVATIFDNQPVVNVKPFGACAILGGPCVPVTPIPWVPGATGILLASPFPLLSADSLLPCAIGGIIQITSAGQSTTFVDTMTMPGLLGSGASPSELDKFADLFLKVSPLLQLMGVKLKVNSKLVDTALMKAARSYRKKAWDLSLSPRSRDALIKRARYLQDIGEGSKALKILRAAGGVGHVVDAATLAMQYKKKDYKGMTATGIGIGATAVCGVLAAPTVAGVAACGLVGVAAGQVADWAIKNPKKALKVASVVISPGGAAAKWTVEHRDDIYKAGKKAVGKATHVAGDVAGVGEKVGGKVIDGAGSVLKKIPKPKIHLPF